MQHRTKTFRDRKPLLLSLVDIISQNFDLAMIVKINWIKIYIPERRHVEYSTFISKNTENCRIFASTQQLRSNTANYSELNVPRTTL